eukprot:12042929-Heterocapsa_arctica.AAC.1
MAHSFRSPNRHCMVSRVRRQACVAPSLGMDNSPTLQRQRSIGGRRARAPASPRLHGGIRLGHQ